MVKGIDLPSDVFGFVEIGWIHAVPKAFFLLFFLKILDRQLKFTIAITQMLVIVTKVLWRLKGFRDV